MTTSIALATPEDAARLLPLVAAFHADCGRQIDEAHDEAALLPLLEGSPLGAVWLFGPSLSPTGFIIVTFGWSIERAGMDASIAALYIRPNVRKRGIASEVLSAIAASLRDVQVKALHLHVDQHNAAVLRLFSRAHFEPQDGVAQMTRTL